MNINVNKSLILYSVANMHLWTCKFKVCSDGSYLAKYYNSDKNIYAGCVYMN